MKKYEKLCVLLAHRYYVTNVLRRRMNEKLEEFMSKGQLLATGPLFTMDVLCLIG